VASKILERLDWTSGGELPIGDKSTPEEIQNEFPGVSKANFKKAVSSLYKQGRVEPGPFSIKLMKLRDDKNQ
jgi:predicted RNA-binding protein (virulence factor B family)